MILYIFYHKGISTTFWGKWTTALQMFCVVGMLLQVKLSMVLWYVTLVFAVVSVVDYLVKGVRLLNRVEPTAKKIPAAGDGTE